MSAATRSGRRTSGVTLLELLLATSLAVLVMAAVLTVTQNALRIWTRGEASRDAREVASVALGSMATDLRQLHASPEGDLVVDWWPFDIERDGTVERIWPRVRFVREVSGAERDAIERRAAAVAARAARAADQARGTGAPRETTEALDESELLRARGVTRSELGSGALGASRDIEGGALAEVLYAVVPEGNEGTARTTGVLVRAERIHVAGEPLRFMDDSIFLANGQPALEIEAQELVAGVLWLEPLLATQTTDLYGDGAWRVSSDLRSAAPSWDAWRRDRPDPDLSALNEPVAGMGLAGDRPLLPRAVRLAIEVQRPAERGRAPRLEEPVDEASTNLPLSSMRGLDGAAGRHVLVGSEWMLVRRASGNSASVVRGARGTRAAFHQAGEPVLIGERGVLEIPIAMHDDDWQLDLTEGRR